MARSATSRAMPPPDDPVVLIVDDDPSLRDALSSLLRSVGLRVEVFGSAPEMLEAPLPDVASCLVLVGLSAVLRGQGGIASAPAKFLVPPAQVVAIRAGRLFDSRSGALVSNQIVLIRGDRIADVGPSVAIPPDARVIDLSAATVLPGMVDAHVHVYPPDDLSQSTRTIVAVANAQADLDAGFTTVLDMDSRGGYGTVDLRNAINRGVLLGPRMQVVGQSLNQRATTSYPSFFQRFQDAFTESKNPN